MQYLPDYKDLVARQFENYVTQHNYNADQIRFLRAVQSVFLQKRHLGTADVSTGSTQRLYEPPLDMFGADAVERWFTEKEVSEVMDLVRRLGI
jgi:type I restriction enzyme, R subunit